MCPELNLYSISDQFLNYLAIYRAGISDNYEPKYESSSHAENFHKFNKYNLYTTLVFFYTFILAMLI